MRTNLTPSCKCLFRNLKNKVKSQIFSWSLACCNLEMIPRDFENLIVFNQPQIVQPCIINGKHTELLFELLKQLYSH